MSTKDKTQGDWSPCTYSRLYHNRNTLLFVNPSAMNTPRHEYAAPQYAAPFVGAAAAERAMYLFWDIRNMYYKNPEAYKKSKIIPGFLIKSSSK